MKPLLLLITFVAFLFFNVWLSIPAMLSMCVENGYMEHPMLRVAVYCTRGDKP